MRISPEQHYILNCSFYAPYRRCETIPIYLNYTNLDSTLEAVSFLDFLEHEYETSFERAQLSTNALCQFYKDKLEHFSYSPSPPASFLALASGVAKLGLASDAPEGVFLDCTVEEINQIKKSIFLPVERFFPLGNPGSGRHVRFASLELKGSGRNMVASRSGWNHAWGGLGFDRLRQEILATAQLNSIASLGAVQVLFASLIQAGNSPAVLSYMPKDVGKRSFIVIGLLARSSNYTRLSNISFAPGAPSFSIESLPDMDRVIEQHASLIAFGRAHLDPSLDNTTLSGVLLDTTSVYSAPLGDWDRPLVVFSSVQKHKLESLEDARNYIINATKQLPYVSTSSAHTTALRNISEYRVRLGLKGLATDWQDYFLQQIAYCWLLRHGMNTVLAEEYAPQIAPCFAPHLHADQLDKETYLRNFNFEILQMGEFGAGSSVVLAEVFDQEREELQNFLHNHKEHFSSLLSTYNSRKCSMLDFWEITNSKSGKLGEPIELLKGDPAELTKALGYKYNSLVMMNRCYNPGSIDSCNRNFALRREHDRFVIECPTIFETVDLAEKDIADVSIVLTQLDRGGKLSRDSVPAQISKLEKSIISSQQGDEFIVEGLVFTLLSGYQVCMPLPLLYGNVVNV